MKAANSGVLFLIELGALAGAAYWGFTRDVSAAWLLGLAAPAVLVALWALFGSPRAKYKTSGVGRVGFEVFWFGAGALALFASGAQVWGLAFAVVCVVSKALAVAWSQ
ncbi:YrdB family protein [Streptomyces canus]|uniref:YrdB family protein n=1 Tax=Streptomyces canus TaxID=58343 RepID=UPI002252B1FB|nr:YrdB family protein [Streptomyces canus]MCX4860587.1 YrdB family protein [Streptomyces canus]WSW34221.1 YrdB family protein [Streptomyces canus]